MNYAPSVFISQEQIPVVDIGPLRDYSNPVAIAKQIHHACKDIGFMYISNHGIDSELITQARRLALEFFRLPNSVKTKLAVNDAHRGFLAIGNARMNDIDNPDLKESLVWGVENKRKNSESELGDNLFEGDNQWPEYPPDLKETAHEYFSAVHVLVNHILTAFAISLYLNEDTFLAGSHSPISRGSFIYYPPQTESMGANQFGVAPHTDFGVLTILCQDEVGGLQVQGFDGRWITAHPIEDTLVVNVGDLLNRWTGGYYRSTPHRVINGSGKERLSIVVAYDPDANTNIVPVKIDGSIEESSLPPITCGEYLKWRFGKSFSYRKKNNDTANTSEE